MKAFTIIEVMVSVAIFSVVMTVALGALLAMSTSDSRAEGLKSVVNTLNFSLDEMSRAARTGTAYDCGAVLPLSGSPTVTDCSSTPASRFAFTSSDGTAVGYCLGAAGSCVGTTVCPAGDSCSIMRYSAELGTFLPITSTQVQITSLSFYVIGATSPTIQPKLTILLSGTAPTVSGQNSNFNIQTSVTQRIYDQ